MQSKTHIVTTITQFIDEVKKEFPETNLEYLNFSADRFIEKQPLPEGKGAEEIWDEHFKGWIIANQIKKNAIPAMEDYRSQPPKEKEYVLPSEELENLKLIRGYFGEHDKTTFEHAAYNTLDKLISRLSSLKEH